VKNAAEFTHSATKTQPGTDPAGIKATYPVTWLAKKPPECLEYILVHELVHLLEPTHNRRFIAFMDHFMPKWQCYRTELNRLLARYETWGS